MLFDNVSYFLHPFTEHYTHYNARNIPMRKMRQIVTDKRQNVSVSSLYQIRMLMFREVIWAI